MRLSSKSIIGLFFAASLSLVWVNNTHAFYVDNSTRKGSYDAHTYFRNVTLAVPVGWSGSVLGCVWGSPTEASKNATLDTINYYRSMAHLQPVTFNPDYSNKAQQAAFMMYANGKLTHYPTSDWKCYTEDGMLAAKSSNLYFGATAQQAIMGYIDEGGDLGHRRWITRGHVAEMGVGDTSVTNALYVTTPYVKRDNTPTLVGWPGSGYIPYRILPNNWSLSTTDYTIDLSGAVATVTQSGTVIPTTTKYLTPGYGDSTISWTMLKPYYTDAVFDTPYSVTISGIKQRATDGTYVPYPDYTYNLTVFDGRYPTSDLGNMLTVHRYYNRKTGTHFYTANDYEASQASYTLIGEGLSGRVYPADRASGIGGTPLVTVHRFYNLATGTHFYTASDSEATSIQQNLSQTYRDEGVAFKAEAGPSSSEGITTLAVHRFYNFKNGTHFYTSSQSEATTVNNTMYSTYRYEGIAYYQYPAVRY